MNAPEFDQFTRWTCIKCGEPGIDSWNKAMHDGIDYEGDYPNPAIFGDACQSCAWPVTVSYTAPDQRPRAIFGPVPIEAARPFAYEDTSFVEIEADPAASQILEPSTRRDADWSQGCLAARGQLQ